MLLFSSLLIGLICVLLVVVILAQNSKGGGLATGMSSATQMMGTRRATDWIERATWVLSALLLVMCLGVNAYVMSDEDEDLPVEQREQVTPTNPQQGGGGASETPSGEGSETPLEEEMPEGG